MLEQLFLAESGQVLSAVCRVTRLSHLDHGEKGFRSGAGNAPASAVEQWNSARFLAGGSAIQAGLAHLGRNGDREPMGQNVEGSNCR